MISIGATGKIDFSSLINCLSEDVINKLCGIITGENKQYTDDILLAADIITGFFLSLKEKWPQYSNLAKLGGALGNLTTLLQSATKI